MSQSHYYEFAISKQSVLAIHGTGDVGTSKAAKLLHKAGLTPKGHNADAGDETLNEERMTYTRDGKKVPGFADAVVPTLEEKTIQERLPLNSENPAREKSENTNETNANGTQDQAHTKDGELYGAPADASLSPKSDNEPPHDRSGVMDADEQEQGAPGARATLRKHLAAKLGGSIWTLPTPTPKVDPEGFEDPISDDFWKNVWVACAVHNVSTSSDNVRTNTHFFLDRNLSQSLPRSAGRSCNHMEAVQRVHRPP